MTLNVATLVTELRKFSDQSYVGFEGFPSSKTEAKSKWATAYDIYASTALDVSLDLVTTKNKPGFQSSLVFGEFNTPAQAAMEFENAFVSYWTGAIFAVGIPPTPAASCTSIGGNGIFGLEATSVVSTIIPNVLNNLLLSVFANNTDNSALPQLQRIADAFHTATTTAVFVLITGTDTTPTPSGPLPITNTCTLA
jgi:hypothetical protein